MFGYIATTILACACFSLGMQVVGCVAVVGGLAYLLPAGDE